MKINQGLERLLSFNPEAVKHFDGRVFIYFDPNEVEQENSDFHKIIREHDLGMVFKQPSAAHKSQDMYTLTDTGADTVELAKNLGLEIKHIKYILAGREQPKPNTDIVRKDLRKLGNRGFELGDDDDITRW